MDGRSRMERVDDWQQRRHGTSVAFATYKKFSDDKTTNLAAMVAFWAFFSIFPLLLVFVTLLGWFLPSGTKTNVLKNVAHFLPIINVNQVSGLSGSWWALIVGVVSALWSGLAVVKALQFAFNSVWEIPMAERPKFVEQTLRGLKVLGTVGLGLVVATVVSSYVTGGAKGLNLHWFGYVAGYVISAALDIGLFVVAFRMLTDREVSTRDQLPGALLSGMTFFVLQQISSFIISNRLHSAKSTYGNFAVVITLLWWFYLQSQLTLLGAQLNVVLRERLYPRALTGAPDSGGDRRAYEAYAEERRYLDNQEVDTQFSGDSAGARGAPAGRHSRGSDADGSR